MVRLLEHTNSFGSVVRHVIRAKFKDEAGNRIFVVGPVARGPYDWSPPYDVVQWKDDMRIIADGL